MVRRAIVATVLLALGRRYRQPHAISVDEERIFLTRDRGLLKRAAVTHDNHVHETNASARAWRSCAGSTCSGPPSVVVQRPAPTVAKEEVKHRLPPRTLRDYNGFQMCQDYRPDLLAGLPLRPPRLSAGEHSPARARPWTSHVHPNGIGDNPTPWDR